MILIDIPLTRTADFANHHFLNQLAEAWHDEPFTADAPRRIGVMGEETQEIHARAVAQSLGTTYLRRAVFDQPFSSDERPIRLSVRQAW